MAGLPYKMARLPRLPERRAIDVGVVKERPLAHSL
jgi:hypothetical protein